MPCAITDAQYLIFGHGEEYGSGVLNWYQTQWEAYQDCKKMRRCGCDCRVMSIDEFNAIEKKEKLQYILENMSEYENGNFKQEIGENISKNQTGIFRLLTKEFPDQIS